MGPNKNKYKYRYKIGGGARGRGRDQGKDAMSRMMNQGMKGMESSMRKMADTEVDLGYQGEWSGMDCADMPINDERLQCNFAKWEYDDPLAKSDVKRKTLNKRRKNKHKYASFQNISFFSHIKFNFKKKIPSRKFLNKMYKFNKKFN